MMKPLFTKPADRDFSKATNQQAFVLEAHNAKDLLHKELDVNRAEQDLLSERIRTMKSFVNDLPSSDSEYSMMVAQIQMDQIELDEIKNRENTLIEHLNQLPQHKTEKTNKKRK